MPTTTSPDPQFMTMGKVFSSRDRMNVMFNLRIGDGLGNNIFPPARNIHKPIRETILDRLDHILDTELAHWGPRNLLSIFLDPEPGSPGEYSFRIYRYEH